MAIRTYAELQTDYADNAPLGLISALTGRNLIDSVYNWTNVTVGGNIYYNAGNIGIGTATIPHGGVGTALLALEGVDGSLTSGPAVQFTTVADDHPLLQIYPFTHDNINIAFDAYIDGAGWKSGDATSNFAIVKNIDLLQLMYDGPVAQGGAVTWNTGLSINTSGLVTIGGDLAVPSGDLTVVAGNAGIGVGTLEAWHAVLTALQIGGNAALMADTAAGASKGFHVMQNVYYDVGYKYISTDEASRYEQAGGEHKFFVAGSGSADTVISFIQAVTIGTTGILNAVAYSVAGTPGTDFNGAVTNITVVKGLVTAAS